MESSEANKMRYTIHDHIALKAGPHHDLRLQMPNDTVRSFAVPKGVPKITGVKRLAIEGPIHKLEDLDFEGEIEEGYGKGVMSITSQGTLALHYVSPKKLSLTLMEDEVEGGFQGSYILIEAPFGRNNNWLIMRR